MRAWVDRQTKKKYVYLHRAQVLAILYILLDVVSKILRYPEFTYPFLIVTINYLVFPAIFDPIFRFRKKFYHMTLISAGILVIYGIGTAIENTAFSVFGYLGTVPTILLFFIFLNSAFMLLKAFTLKPRDLASVKKTLHKKSEADKAILQKYRFLHKIHVLAVMYILINLAGNILRYPELIYLFIPVLIGYLIFPEILDSIFQFRTKFYLVTFLNAAGLTFSGFGGGMDILLATFVYIGDLSTILLFFILSNSVFVLKKVFNLGPRDILSAESIDDLLSDNNSKEVSNEL